MLLVLFSSSRMLKVHYSNYHSQCKTDESQLLPIWLYWPRLYSQNNAINMTRIGWQLLDIAHAYLCLIWWEFLILLLGQWGIKCCSKTKFQGTCNGIKKKKNQAISFLFIKSTTCLNSPHLILYSFFQQICTPQRHELSTMKCSQVTLCTFLQGPKPGTHV